MLGVRLDEQMEQRLSALAEKTNRSKSYLTKEALKRYLEEEETKEAEKELLLARWERYQQNGESIPGEEVDEWLASWGSAQEKPCPKR